MRHLVLGLIIAGDLILGGLAHYELTAKSPRWLGHPLPGWQRTLRIEQVVSLHHWTGLRILDRLLHEGEEAAVYYGLARTAAMSRPPSPVLDVPQQR